MHVTDLDNPEEASFFESFEAAHSLHDLSSLIAKVSALSTFLFCILFSLNVRNFSHSILMHMQVRSLFFFYKQKLGVKAPPVRIDSQAKYGALSRGDGAIYLRFPHKGYREKIWDHAAGYLVVAGP